MRVALAGVLLSTMLAAVANAAQRQPMYVPTGAIEATFEERGISARVGHFTAHAAVLRIVCTGQGFPRAGRFHLFDCFVTTKNGTNEIHVTTFRMSGSKWFYTWTFV